MGKVYGEIDDRLAEFIGRQHVFFVATAPLDPDGHVNVSPKGLDTFRVLGPRRVAYLDLTGSGIETVSHLRENGRIVVMFCAFEGAPKIVRLHGRGEAVEEGDPRFPGLRARFGDHVGVRSVVLIELDRISDSCGYGMPSMVYDGDRDTLVRWTLKRGDEGVRAYREEVNGRSVDGLPGLPSVTPRER